MQYLKDVTQRQPRQPRARRRTARWMEAAAGAVVALTMCYSGEAMGDESGHGDATVVSGEPVVAVESYHCNRVGDDVRGGGGGRGGGGRGGGGGGAGPLSDEARADIQTLVSAHTQIKREVAFLADGVETWTTSDDPLVVAALRRHVEAMQRRVYIDKAGVRMWDPLFAAITREHDDAIMELELLDAGVHAKHVGANPGVIALIHAHAQVVSRFVQDGLAEERQCHKVSASP
jgi:hypothetical protein